MSNRITLMLNDPEGNPIGVRSLTRKSILTVDFAMYPNKLILVLTELEGRTETYPEPVRVYGLKKEKRLTGQKDEEGKDVTELHDVPTEQGGSTMMAMVHGRTNHKMIEITGDDVKMVWEWLHEGLPEKHFITYDQVQALREEAIAKVQEARKEKAAELAEKEKEETAGSGIILNQHGAPVSDLDK